MNFSVVHSEKNPAVLRTKTIHGHTYTLTGEYLLKDGKPYIYTMGELHYSRVRAEDWERELRKMKDGGIDIVSSYVFWNHHEATRGQFDFSGNRDIRKFIDTCAKLDMPFFLRIGPWAHGEARRGGFPDWLEAECSATRSTDKTYLSYVERFYSAIASQVKTSDNIIGIQVENEYSGGPEYLQVLYDMIKRIGLDAFLFTATGWNGELPDCLIPMFGAYPEAPWEKHTHVFSTPETYGFYSHDAEGYKTRFHTEGRRPPFPTMTCELGGGNQSTYRRRPLIMPWDVAALTVIQLGSGCKGLGYYMYHGGQNPVLTDSDRLIASFQESRESGYPTDCPVISYDFQAPLGDCGQRRQSWYELKTLLDFVKTEGGALAPMERFSDTEAPKPEDLQSLRAGIVSDGERGYLFYMNVFHGHAMAKKQATARICLAKETLSVPVEAPPNGYGIIPFNYPVGDCILKWVRAIPVKKSGKSVTFSVIPGTAPEYLPENGDRGDLRNIKSIGGMEILLTETEHPTQARDRILPVEKEQNCLSFDFFKHIIPEKDMHLPDLTAEYTVRIPEGVDYVSVIAEGNVGLAYAQDADGSFRVLSDHYLDGDEWIVDVRGVCNLRLKIQPFREEDKPFVYLEKAFRVGSFPPRVYALPSEVFVPAPVPFSELF